MLEEVHEVRVVGKTSTSMLMYIRSGRRVNFHIPILGELPVIIEDGIADTIYHSDQSKIRLYQDDKKDYILVTLQGGSTFKITNSTERNSLIFEFNAPEKMMPGLRETVLGFVEYNY